MTENPYKGIPGGDPRLRDSKVKKKVKMAFTCAECNQEKTEIFFEGKDLTGRVCTECRNAEGVRKHKIQEEENAKLWAEYRRKERNRPNRSAEEKKALLKEFAGSPKEECVGCHKEFFIYNPAFPFTRDIPWKDNAILTVSYVNDPYALEIEDKEVPNWLCEKCYKDFEMDI